MPFTPPYPKPHTRKSTFLLRFLRGWHSWLHILFERSYTMKMGQIAQPGMRAYMINDLAWVRRILVETPSDYPKHRLLHQMLEPLLGDSIFTSNGEAWARQRRLVDSAFEQARLKTVFPLMAAAVADMKRRLDATADGTSHEIDAEMTYVTADIIFRTILSEPLTAHAASVIFKEFTHFQRHAQRAMILSVYRLPTFWLTRASRKSAKAIREILSGIIQARFLAYTRGDENQPQDILQGLMETPDPITQTRFSYEELVDQVCMLFLAGHETSASALTWTLYLLSRSPELQTTLVAEVAHVTQGAPLAFGDARHLKMTWNTFRESLRLYPPVGVFMREATHDHCIRDKQIKTGSPILISPWLLHRHRDLWERPDEFDPHRFETEAGQQSAKCAFIPFSKGERVCIGAAFATQEALLVLATIIRHFVIEPDLAHTPHVVGRVTIRSENGVRVRLRPRHPENNKEDAL